MHGILKELSTQLGALVAFFAFPAIQYLLLKRLARKEGAPELWYLRRYCFRLVIRNITKRRVLTDIKIKVRTRKIVGVKDQSLTKTFQDEILVEQQDFFTFPGTDHVMVCFTIKQAPDSSILFMLTDKFGSAKQSIGLDSFDELICDYVANIKNPFNFDIKLQKRAILTSTTMIEMLHQIGTTTDPEIKFKLDSIKDIG